MTYIVQNAEVCESHNTYRKQMYWHTRAIHTIFNMYAHFNQRYDVESKTMQWTWNIAAFLPRRCYGRLYIVHLVQYAFNHHEMFIG